MNELEVFTAALDVPEAEQEAYIRRACAVDEVLLREAQALLEAHSSRDNFLDRLSIRELIGWGLSQILEKKPATR